MILKELLPPGVQKDFCKKKKKKKGCDVFLPMLCGTDFPPRWEKPG